MNRLANILSHNSKLIIDSRSIASTISSGDINIYPETNVNMDVKLFRQQQMADRVLRNSFNTPDMILFRNSIEFKVAYMDFKQQQMVVRATRNKDIKPKYKDLDKLVKNHALIKSSNMLQEDVLTAI